MTEVTKAINKFIQDEIKLFQEDISSAVTSREWFLNRIKSKINNRENEPSLYEDPFVYFGSYFKKTKVSNVDEFDVLVVIDSNTGEFKSDGNLVGTGLGNASPNHKYDKKYKKSDDSGVSPSKLLNWLKGIVEEVVDEFNGEAPERDGQAITARIKSKDLKIDLVPAGIFKKEDGTIFYIIPKGNKSNGWLQTQPKDDIYLLNEVAKGKDNFRNIVRILKFIRTNYNFKISSFAIESAVVNYGQEYTWKNEVYSDLKNCLTYLKGKIDEGEIKNPINSSFNLIDGVESLSYYSRRIENIINSLEKLENEKEEEIYNKLNKLFKNE